MKMLVYPVPDKELTGLGIHTTLDLGGRLRFGPDAEYVDDYKGAGKMRYLWLGDLWILL